MADRAWIVTAICGDCLTSDTGRAILNGAVGIATIGTGAPERCILCGHVFADQIGREHGPEWSGYAP